jgi:hypothetical protein
VTQIQLTLVISYLLITVYFFTNWLKFSLLHPTYTPEDKFLSFVMFVITTIFWPLIIPISCFKILKNRQLESNTVIPVLLAIFAASISYCIVSL